MNQHTVKYRGYEGSVLYDAEDNLLHGKLIGIRDFILYEGENEPALERNFREAVDDYLQFCCAEGKTPEKPFTLFPIQMPPELHKRVSLFAEQNDLELNAVVEKALTEFLTHAG